MPFGEGTRLLLVDRTLAARGHAGDFGQAEVENLCVTTLTHKDVGGFNVAVDDSFGMSGVQGVGDFNPEPEQGFKLQRSPTNAVLQRCTL